MAEDCVHFVSMIGSPCENEEKYSVYESGAEMFRVVGIENKQGMTTRTPGTKSRYKQSYREAWESMRDFKGKERPILNLSGFPMHLLASEVIMNIHISGWLTSVPGNTSKAYCKLCQKELHCHRLSLLKHKVTVKHQKKEEEHNLMNQRGKNICLCMKSHNFILCK